MCLKFRSGALLIVVALVLATPVSLWASGVLGGGELVVYRLGNSLLLLNGEPWGVLPVQGFPSALLSLGLTAILSDRLGTDLGTLTAMSLYGYLMLVGELCLACVVLAGVWLASRFETADRVVISLIALVPWYAGGPSYGLMLAPDYWPVEYGYALGTAAWALWLVRGHRCRLGLRGSAMLGAWAAFGLLTKAPDAAGALLILSVARPRRFVDWLAAAVVGATLAVTTLLTYALGSVEQAWAMARFWVVFLVEPNQSASWATLNQTLPSYLAARPLTLAILAWLGVMVALAIAAGTRRLLIAGVALWLAPFGYLLARRVHDTSAASLLFVALAVIALLTLTLPRWRSLGYAVLAAGLIGVPLLTRPPFAPVRATAWLNQRAWEAGDAAVDTADNLSRWEVTAGRHYWYVPNNLWVSAVPAAMMAYNGGLGMFPLTVVKDELTGYSRGGGALRALFGDMVLLGGSEFERFSLLQAFDAGRPILWSDPPTPDLDNETWLREALLSRPHTLRQWRTADGAVIASMVVRAQ